MRYFLILPIALTLLSGCFQDTEETSEVIIKPVPTTTLASADVVIKVNDESGKPVSGLTARFNKVSKVIDKTSVFHFTGKNLAKENELLLVTDDRGKTYEFNLYNIENQVNYHQITLFSSFQQSKFNPRNQHVVSLPSNACKLQFEAQVYASGTQDYGGEILTEYLDYNVQDPLQLRALPGGNILFDDGTKKLIQCEKAFYVRLSTPDEKHLTWQKPHKGIFNQPFDENTYLLFYDERSHQWKKLTDLYQKNEVLINQSGTYMVAKLETYHVISGTWNVKGSPLAGSALLLSAGAYTSTIHTTNTGYWESLVPGASNVKIRALFSCPATLEIETPTAGIKTDTGIRNFDSPQLSLLEISGKVLDCMHQPLRDNILYIHVQGETLPLFMGDPEFSLKIPVCTGGDRTLQVVNGPISSTQIQMHKESLRLGNVYVCEELKNNYITLATTEGYVNLSQNMVVENDGQKMVMNMLNGLQNLYISFTHGGTEGLLSVDKANIVWEDPDFSNTGIEIKCPTSSSCGFENIEITHFGQDGWIRGQFTGRFWTKTFRPLSAKYQEIKADFQLKTR